MEKVIRDGKVAVLISPGFGAGWSTWNSEYGDDIIFDPELVHMVESEAHYDTMISYCKRVYPDAYLGGLSDLCIVWLTQGTLFRIEEYDGSESLRTADSTEWSVA